MSEEKFKWKVKVVFVDDHFEIGNHTKYGWTTVCDARWDRIVLQSKQFKTEEEAIEFIKNQDWLELEEENE